MASEKISQLPSATTTTGPDLYPLVQGGGNYSITFSRLQSAIFSNLTSSQLPTITLTGDVTGSASGGTIPTTVASVGGASASNVASATAAYLAATSLNTPSTLVKRDGSGNFSAGVITANLTGSASNNVLKSGDTMSGDLNMGGNNIDNVTSIFGEQRLVVQNRVHVKLNPGFGEFSSVAAALASVTTASITNPFVIFVEPGIYVEPQLVMKPFVSVRGINRMQTLLVASNPNQAFIVAADFSSISQVTISGATGINGVGIQYTSSLVGGAFSAEYSNFGNNTVLVKVIGTAALPTNLLMESCVAFNFSATTGVLVDGTLGVAQLEASGCIFLQTITTSRPTDYILAHGSGATVFVNGSLIAGLPSSVSGNAVHSYDGADVTIAGSDIVYVSKCVWVENSGAAPKITVVGTHSNYNTQDFVIDHPGTVGSISASASEETSVFNSGNFGTLALLLLDPDGDIITSGVTRSRQPDNTFADITTLTSNASPVGILNSGDINPPLTGSTVTVEAGFGYLQKSDGSLHKITWNDTPITVPANSEHWLYFDSTGTLQQNGIMPDNTQNIVIGRVVTDISSDIIIVEESGFFSVHAANAIGTALRNGLGSVFSTGATVAEVGTRQLDVTAGQYYYGERQFLSNGGNPVIFSSFYQNGSGGFTDIDLQNAVDNANYDNGTGTLAPITSGNYAKHSLYLLGDSTNDFDSEAYFLVYSQQQFTSLTLAEQGSLPNPPSYFSGAVTLIASLIVSPGSTHLVEIRDERPIISSKRVSTVSATSFHHNLLGLNDFDDHLRYLPVDGSRPMTANLPMGGFNISNIGTANFPSLTASLPLQLDASHNTIASAIDLSSSQVINTLPNAHLAQMANNTVKGNKSGSSATPSDLALSDVAETVSSVLTILNGSKAIVGSSNLTIQVTQASGSASGYLSSTDWNTFNNKQPAGSYITSLTGEVTASGPGAASATLSNAAVIGKVLTGFSAGPNSAILATDSILAAFQKTQSQVTNSVRTINANGGTQEVGNVTLQNGNGVTVTDSPAGTFTIDTKFGANEFVVTSTSGLQINYSGGRFENGLSGTVFNVPSGSVTVAANTTLGYLYVAVNSLSGTPTVTFSTTPPPLDSCPFATYVSGASTITSTTDIRFFVGKQQLADIIRVTYPGTGLVVNYNAGRVRINGTIANITDGTLLLTASTASGAIYVDPTSLTVVANTTGTFPSNCTPLATYTTSGTAVTALTGARVFLNNNVVFGASGDIQNLTPNLAASAGSTNRYADAGHIHNVPTAAPANQTITAAASDGSAATFSRSDHLHTFSTAAASSISTSTANGAGTSTSFVRADHTHAVSVTNQLVSATANGSLLSATDTLVTGMTATPAAGTYAVFFNGNFTDSSHGSLWNISIYAGGVQATDSVRTTDSSGGANGVTYPLSTQSIVTVNGSQAIELRANNSSGTITPNTRSIILMKLS